MKTINTIDEIIYTVIVYIKSDNFIAKKYKLHKINQYLSPMKLNEIKDLTNFKISCISSDFNSNKSLSSFSHYLNNFIDVMRKNFSPEDLANLYNNIVNLSVEFFSGQGGYYNIKQNKIKLSKNKIGEFIYHELFHVSSNNVNVKNNTSGFMYSCENYDIGYGINEGYTELLTNRYFDLSDKTVYLTEQKISKCLEYIIGQQKMQSLYLNSDLYNFINILKKYYTDEEIEKFIVKVDFLSYYTEKNYLGDYEVDIIKKQYEDIIYFLIKGFCIKMREFNCPIDKFLEEFNLYFSSINFYVEEDNDKTFCYDVDKIDEIIANYYNPYIKSNISVPKQVKSMI